MVGQEIFGQEILTYQLIFWATTTTGYHKQKTFGREIANLGKFHELFSSKLLRTRVRIINKYTRIKI